MTRDSRIFYLLLLLAFTVFAANIGGYDVWPPDEPRYTEVAREMVVSGDYLVPRVNGEVYFEKPPMLFWLMALASVPFGEVNEVAARLPSVLCAVYIVGLTYALAARLFTRQVAIWAALLLITCFRFWYQARKGQIDMVLTAEMLTTLYAFWRWDESRHTKWLFLAYGGIALGLLTKGPPALVFPGLFLMAYYWGNREGRASTRWVWGFLGAIAVAALWYVPARMAGADTAAEAVQSGMGSNLFRNTIGRALMGVSKAQPPWYYLKTLPVDMLPWTFICPPILYWAWKGRKENQAMRFLWAWIGPALIFFSVIIGKRELYLLPLFPVFGILFAAAMEHLKETENYRWMRRGGMAWSVVLIAMGFSPLALPYIPYTLESNLHLYIVAGVALVVGNAGLFYIRKSSGSVVPTTLATQTILIFTVAVFTVFPEIDTFKSAREICAPVRQLVEDGKDPKVYSAGFSREEYVYYARHFHEPVFTGLIGDIHPDNLMEQAKLQKKAQRLFQDAVEEVPVVDLAQPTEAEQTALRAAIDAAVAESDEIDAIVHFEDELRVEVNAFFTKLGAKEPVFCFVQEEDWRWLLAFLEGEQPTSVITEQGVGSRHVLLLANDAALEALSSANSESSK